MPDEAAWLAKGTLESMTAAVRAVLTWRHIRARPTSVVLLRGATLLAAQTVRIEEAPAGERSGPAAVSAKRSVTVFGVTGHPDATVLDTDIQRGDRFNYGGAQYKVVDVLTYPGQLQCVAEAQS